MLLSTVCYPEKSRNVSTTLLLTGTYSAIPGSRNGLRYNEGRSIFKKFPFFQAKCKEFDTPNITSLLMQ